MFSNLSSYCYKILLLQLTIFLETSFKINELCGISKKLLIFLSQYIFKFVLKNKSKSIEAKTIINGFSINLVLDFRLKMVLNCFVLYILDVNIEASRHSRNHRLLAMDNFMCWDIIYLT